MATKFNDQQLTAINALGKNVVVSASAGAGKTTVLIERLMKRILIDGVSISRICALTFTDAAANEMKKRLLAALYEKNTQEPSPYLSQQMMLVETSHISTIHSFCLSIIKDHGYLLGISDEMTQNILDPGLVSLYQKQAHQECMEAWSQDKRDKLKELLRQFTRKPQDTKPFFDVVLVVSKFLDSKHNPQATIQEIINTYQATQFSDLPQSIQYATFNHHYLQCTQVIDSLKALIQCVDAIDDQEAVSVMLLTHLNQLLAIKKQIEDMDISFIPSLVDALNIKLKTIRGQEDYKLAGDNLALVVDAYAKTIEPLSISLQTLNQQAPIIQSLLCFVTDYQSRFQALKQEAQGMDFDDFEHIAYKLLTMNNNALAHELRQQFDEIMVDEFQDTNDYQDAIIQAISNGTNIFRVGDVKQSIYRFRGAKPSIMQNLMKHEDIDNIYLSFNYRSKEDIVFFNNDFFNHVLNMTQGMSYSQYDTVQAGIPTQKVNSHPVEFLIVEDPESRPEDNLDYLPWDKNINIRKARIIAQEVIRHHNMGYKFRDIVILTRSHANKVFLKRAFEEVNIPHFIDDRGGFYQSSIVSAVLSFFKFVLDETDYSLANVLKSPFIGYTYNDLAQLKLNASSSLWSALKQSDSETYETLKSFKNKWAQQDVITCILNVINLNNAYHQALSIQDKTNIDALLEKAITYQASNNPSLTGFMDFVDNLNDDKSPEAIPLSDNDDVVTAMTIHQSKGLQFPVVILWSMGRRTNRDLRGSVVCDDSLGISIVDKVLPLNIARHSYLYTLIKTKQEGEDLEETLRLVYVALTRPQERLVVVELVDGMKDQTLNQNLLYSYSKLIELLVIPASKHKRVTSANYETIPYRILQPQDTEQNTISFSLPQLKQTTTEEIYHGSFDFNPEFLEATSYGSTLHKAAEDLPQRTWTQDDLASIPPKFHKALLSYNQHPFTQTLYTANQKYQEIPFIYNVDDTLRNGIIDAYYVFADKVILVDYKTDNTNADTLSKRYHDQLDVYKQALATSYPDKNIETYIYSFHNNDYIKMN